MESPVDVHRRFAAEMADEIGAARAAGEALRLIVPVGADGAVPLLAELLNERAEPLDHVTFYGMDEWLDWEGRPLGSDHPFSLEGGFRRLFLDRLDREPAAGPGGGRSSPSPYRLETVPEDLAEAGRIATTYGGFGYRGHVAFNEPPGTRLSPVSLDQLRRSQDPRAADRRPTPSSPTRTARWAGTPPGCRRWP